MPNKAFPYKVSPRSVSIFLATAVVVSFAVYLVGYVASAAFYDKHDIGLSAKGLLTFFAVPIIAVSFPVLVAFALFWRSAYSREVLSGTVAGVALATVFPFVYFTVGQAVVDSKVLDDRVIRKVDGAIEAILLTCGGDCNFVPYNYIAAIDVPVFQKEHPGEMVEYRRKPAEKCDSAQGDFWESNLVHAGYFDWCLSRQPGVVPGNVVEIEVLNDFELAQAGTINGVQLRILQHHGKASKLLTHWATGDVITQKIRTFHVGKDFDVKDTITEVLGLNLDYERNDKLRLDPIKAKAWALKHLDSENSNEKNTAQSLLDDLLQAEAHKNDLQILQVIKSDFEAGMLKDGRPPLNMLYGLKAEQRRPFLPAIEDYLLRFDPNDRSSDKSTEFQFLKDTKGYNLAALSPRAEAAFSAALEAYPHASSRDELYGRMGHVCNLLLVLAAANTGSERERLLTIAKMPPERAAEVIGKCMFGYRPTEMGRFRWNEESYNSLLEIISKLPLKEFGEFVYNNGLIESLDQQQLPRLQKLIDEFTARESKSPEYEFSKFDLEQATISITRRLKDSG